MVKANKKGLLTVFFTNIKRKNLLSVKEMFFLERIYILL